MKFKPGERSEEPGDTQQLLGQHECCSSERERREHVHLTGPSDRSCSASTSSRPSSTKKPPMRRSRARSAHPD